MASKSTFEALSFGTILGPMMRPNLRCMYITKVQVELETVVQVFTIRVKMCSPNAISYCSAL